MLHAPVDVRPETIDVTCARVSTKLWVQLDIGSQMLRVVSIVDSCSSTKSLQTVVESDRPQVRGGVILVDGGIEEVGHVGNVKYTTKNYLWQDDVGIAETL